MGMRRNIRLDYKDDKKIFLYTHWHAEGLEETLAQSLDRARERWNDPSYLARVIFTDMTQSVGKDLTGFGLAPYETDPEYDTLVVDLENKTVNDIAYEEFIGNPSMFKID